MAEKDSAVRLSLLDVLYGVVLGYGFTYFDKADSIIGYFRFFFSYIIIIIDWIYVHRFYWKKEYKFDSLLFIDIGVIFTISRILYTSTSDSPNYFLWLSILFLWYIAWDIFSKRKELSSEYNWKYALAGDIFASLCYALFWIATLYRYMTNLWVANIGIIVIYSVAFACWLKKSES